MNPSIDTRAMGSKHPRGRQFLTIAAEICTVLALLIAIAALVKAT